jgi:intracellular septation protein A
MDEVIAGVLLLAATVVATVKAFKEEAIRKSAKIYTILALAAGGLFVLFGDAFVKAVEEVF